MLSSNHGLDRRFPRKFYFPNFTPEDCAKLVRRELEKAYFSFEDGLLDRFGQIARAVIEEKRENFGNAGWVKNDLLASKLLPHMKSRVSDSSLALDNPDRRKVLLVDLLTVET